MAIITLTTDWNKSDYYIGAVKGRILSVQPLTTIVDISHQVIPFNIMQAAFIVRNCWFEFPEGTVHLIAVNAALTEKTPLLIIEKNKQYFIAADNGITGLLFGDGPDAVYKVTCGENGNTFTSLKVFIDTAFRIQNGEKLSSVGEEVHQYNKQIPLRPVIDKNLINGSIIYIDSFSNAITNISRETFDKVGKEKAFEIFIQSNHYRVDHINTSYSDSESGELLVLFNSAGLLEIAINHGSASELLNLSINSTVRIKFYDEKPESKLKLTGT